MTESTFILWGIKFATEEWEPLIGNFLIMTGIVLTLYIALFFGNDRESLPFPQRPESSSPRSAKKKSSSGTLLFSL